MFDLTLPVPRGFLGRPLIALRFAVGTGILASYVGSQFHIGDLGMVAIVITTVGVVGHLWDQAE